MNYELVKKLRDEGFPYHWERAANPEPSLQELIEACGEGFFRLSHSSNNDGSSWDAEGWESGEIYTGYTPKESVAKLWLSLKD